MRDSMVALLISGRPVERAGAWLSDAPETLVSATDSGVGTGCSLIGETSEALERIMTNLFPEVESIISISVAGTTTIAGPEGRESTGGPQGCVHIHCTTQPVNSRPRARITR